VKFLQQIPKAKLQQMMLVGIFTIITLVAVWQFWISDEQTALEANQKAVEELAPKIEEAERTEKNEARNESLKHQLIAYIQGQRSSMVSGDFFAWAVREMTLLAERHPVQVSNIRGAGKVSTASRSGDGYLVQLEIRGNYDAIGGLVADLENRFPTAQVRMLEIGGGDAQTATRIATLEVVFMIWQDATDMLINSKAKT
jgi:hypothetical protein